MGDAAIDEHRITSLPGWDGELPEMYSGYMPVGNTSGVPGFIHYWFIVSQNNPQKDPVAYWTNGGPGGSGINAGLLKEMGLVHLNEGSMTKQGVKLFKNAFAWSNVASMLYVSQPKGVGFSYCADMNTKCVNNDQTAAQDAGDFFENFFAAYPEYSKNEFYLTAESYGGIYIPMFMDEIDRRASPLINLKGAAIGDGCWGTSVGMCNFTTGKSKQISAEFYAGHAMYDQPLYASIKESCGDFSDADVLKKDCVSDLKEMSDKIGKFDIYNIYDTCNGDTVGLTHEEVSARMSDHEVVVEDETLAAKHPQLVNGAVNDYPCGGDAAVAAWLSQKEVADALHVKSGTPGMTYNWGPYNISGDLRPLYHRLAQTYRIMIYSGDTDACVPYWGTEEWTRELGFPVKTGWRPWHAEHLSRAGTQRAGYVIDYDSGGTGFKFVTVQGAGHLVPTYKPHFALTMITKFLKNEDF